MKNIDFHSHILPKVDHGSDSIMTSLEQIKMAKSIGIDTIVATPHFYPHTHNIERYMKRRYDAFNLLKESLSSSGIDMNLILGCEVLLCENLEKLEGLEALTIGNAKNVLIELPFSDFRQEYINSLENLVYMGYKIILAHAERYRPEYIEAIIPLGVKIQLNATALSGCFIKRSVKRWLDNDLVVGLGSDIHMLDKKAYRDFSKVMRKSSDRYIQIMNNSENLLFRKTD